MAAIIWSQRIARFLIGAVFVASALVKLKDPQRFLLDMQLFPFLPYGVAFATSLVLPWVELFAAIGVWSGRLLRGSLLALMLLMLGFIAFLSLAWIQGIDAHCGCFGDWLVFPNYASHIVFNAVLLVMAGWLMKGKASDLSRGEKMAL